MALSFATRTLILRYAKSHLGDETWHRTFFDFVGNRQLRHRLGQEFWAARVLYKMLEGVQAKGTLKRTEIKIQILQYASIYEATLHYVLFTKYKVHPEVRKLSTSLKRTTVHLASDLWERIERTTRIARAELAVQRTKVGNADITKIRFDAKAEAARAIGLIDSDLCSDLVAIYSARNAIHLHAEIRKALHYQLALSMKAYRRLRPFRDQLRRKLARDGKIS